MESLFCTILVLYYSTFTWIWQRWLVFLSQPVFLLYVSVVYFEHHVKYDFLEVELHIAI